MEAGHDHMEREGEESPRGREVRVWESGESKKREEGQVAPLIVHQTSGAGHTWLLPGRCGVELRQNTNREHSVHSISQMKGFLHTPRKEYRGLGSEETPCVSTKISK